MLLAAVVRLTRTPKRDPRRNPRLKFPEWLPKRTDGLCRCGCGKPVPKGRRQWATGECKPPKLEEFYILQGYNDTIRKAVFRRDKGVCAGCGLDTAEAAERCSKWGGDCSPKVQANANAARAEFMARGFPSPQYGGKNWWEADHIIPVSMGGPNTLENFRTLCIACHRGETRRLAALRARARSGRVFGLETYLFPMGDKDSANLHCP